ncbi:FxsA family protein [Leekyejoonella antrihumi]|uniref:FxsA family protein n=1 Tax=Leekyejoonella antrihumi TaxID=1660198 RepID=A0A563E3W1_9MICO|nr:FxsA family protein [Leekyejoonella antrihumi]
MEPRPRPLWARLLLVGLLLVPVVEIVVIVLVAHLIGWWTLLLLIVFSVAGGWLVRRQWSSTWTQLQDALQTGRMPARELTDTALLLVGGAFLMIPGFVTDVVGLILVAPFTRPLTRLLLQFAVTRRMWATVAGPSGSMGPMGWRSTGPRRGDDQVIEGEIVDDDEDDTP